MTVLSTTDYSGPYAPDGVTTVFPFNFSASSAEEVAVIRMTAADEPTELTGYTVTINDSGGGSIHFTAAPAVGDPIYIALDPSFEQQYSFNNQGAFNAKMLTKALDQAARRCIALAAAISRAPLAPPADSLGVLPRRDIRAGRYMAFDAEGLATVTDGTGADGSMRTDLASSGGSALVGYSRPVASAAIVSQASLNSRRLDIRDWNGVDLTGTNDMASEFAAGLADSDSSGTPLNIPSGVLVLGSSVAVPGGARINGVGTMPYQTEIQGAYPTIGSWLHIGHTGVGLTCGDGGTLTSGIALDGFGTFRTQPAIGSGWAPTAHDFDIVVNNADVEIGDLMLLNATKGLKLTNGQAGRLSIGRLRGQCFQTGIEVEQSLDILKADLIQFWPFWADNTFVHTYTKSSLDAVKLYRADGPHIDTLFSIYARSTLRLAQNAFGKTTAGKINQMFCDLHGLYGLWVDSTADAALIQIGLINSQGETGFTGSRGIYVEGPNCQIDISQHQSRQTGGSAVAVDGTASTVRIALPSAANFNQDNNSSPAYHTNAGNTLKLLVAPTISGSNNSGTTYGGAGSMQSPDNWNAYTPTITAGSGTITTVGTVSAQWKQTGDIIDLYGSVAITTAGTGAGSLNVSLPFTTASFATGVATLTSGTKSGAARITSGGNTALLTAADGTTFIANGNVVTFAIRFRV
jgi:hypothetical protein